MTTTLEQRREEALKRLNFLKQNGMTYAAPIRAFRDKGDIGIFENQGGFAKAVYYEMRLNSGDGDRYDEMCKAVEEYEAEENATVYLILVNHTPYGEVWSFLHVSDYPDSWEDDMNDLKDGYVCVRAHNRENPLFSDTGDVGFAYSPAYGGIYRIS